MSTKIKDLYEDTKEFTTLLEQAEENATTKSEMEFIDEISNKVAKWGEEAYFSLSQNRWLRRIAGESED